MSDLVERLRKRADHWKQNKLGRLEYEIYDDAADLIQSQAARIKVLEEALENIAAFHDIQASRRCDNTGSYALFDEPGSVEIARQALKTGGE